jgi:hypothetical protein
MTAVTVASITAWPSLILDRMVRRLAGWKEPAKIHRLYRLLTLDRPLQYRVSRLG